MKNVFKTIAILILLLAVSTPVLLGFMTYKFQLKKIKKQVKQELIANTSKAELVAFEFDINSKTFKSLNWKHSREFEFNNKMFDIVEADTLENVIHYLCFPDKQETELNAKFKALLNARYASDIPLSNKQNLLANFIKSLFDETLPEFKFFNSESFKIEYNLYGCFYYNRYKELLDAPPQFV